MSSKDLLKEKLDEEIEHRVEILEDQSYEFGPTLIKLDFILVFITVVICIAGLIWGYH